MKELKIKKNKVDNRKITKKDRLYFAIINEYFLRKDENKILKMKKNIIDSMFD